MSLLWNEPVQDAWIDYNGHLSEAYYVLVFGHATDNVMDAVGIDATYREAHDASLYTLEAHVRYLAEVPAGADLEVRSSVIGVSGKLLWIWHELWVDDRLRATEEVLGVHVRGGASAPMPDDIAAAAGAARVAPPDEASGRIRPLADPATG
ncbi:thioesterase family protein [Nocardioides currus]|uniref:4-hydroxybenzoyl-CoA thioesterase n=1 Tax=Nocardioides currus TaxID=2133958 RepID=A0A2R7YZU8_9ACTN|nr:thioesterase family protein [Nocardioides currus]PUA81905.1 4-hydroxybenzoyl-CoA thioesterase [Nocardioides currus]